MDEEMLNRRIRSRAGIDLSKFQEGCERMGGEYIESLGFARCDLKENGRKVGQLLYGKRGHTITLLTEHGSADVNNPTDVEFNFTSDFDEMVVEKEVPERGIGNEFVSLINKHRDREEFWI